MTNNQIAYHSLQEAQRHNRAQEWIAEQTLANERSKMRETKRSNLAKEGLTLASVQESIRHNTAQEVINSANVNESVRHNIANETISSASVSENVRHNIAGEVLESAKVNESIRHNLVNEAQTAWMNSSSIQEQIRTNLTREKETLRHNLVTEAQDWVRVNASQTQAQASLIGAGAAKLQADTASARLTLETPILESSAEDMYWRSIDSKHQSTISGYTVQDTKKRTKANQPYYEYNAFMNAADNTPLVSWLINAAKAVK